MRENQRHDCTNISSTITAIRDILSAFPALDDSAIKFYYFPHKLLIAQILLLKLKYTIRIITIGKFYLKHFYIW